MEERIARWAVTKEYIEPREIFDTTTFLYLGNFLVTADEGDLVVRLDDAGDQEARKLDGGRAWRVGAPGTPTYTLIPARHLETDEQLHAWLDRALEHSKTLEPKERLVTKKVLRPDWLDPSS